MLNKNDIEFLKALKDTEKVETHINQEEKTLDVHYRGKVHSVPLLLTLENAIKIEKAQSDNNMLDVTRAIFGEEICTEFSQIAIEELFKVYQEIIEVFNGVSLGE